MPQKAKIGRPSKLIKPASPDLPQYYVNLIYPTLFGISDFLTPGVNLQPVSAFSKETLVCESAFL